MKNEVGGRREPTTVEMIKPFLVTRLTCILIGGSCAGRSLRRGSRTRWMPRWLGSIRSCPTPAGDLGVGQAAAKEAALMQAATRAIRENFACRFLAGKAKGFWRQTGIAPWEGYRYKVIPAEKAGVNDGRESQRSR